MLASITIQSIRVINLLPIPWTMPDPLSWSDIAGPLVAAEDALARLDERLSKSPIREGFVARTHFADAAAALWLEGSLVHMEDLVLHDAGMDIRAPTHEMTRAHAILRARRRIFADDPDWAFSPAGLDVLRGRAGELGTIASGSPAPEIERRGAASGAGREEEGADLWQPLADPDGDDAWLAELAAIDAVVDRSAKVLDGAAPLKKFERDPLVYDLDWDEEARLKEWRAVVEQTKDLPPVLAAALALEAWQSIEPLQHQPWLGPLLGSALLKARGKTRAYLTCLNIGLKQVPREKRRALGQTTRLLAQIEAVVAAAEAGLKDHDRWLNMRRQLERKTIGRRSTSKLPDLIDLVLATPIASANMIAEAIDVTPRAAQDMVVELGLREATGRGRYRAWGIL